MSVSNHQLRFVSRSFAILRSRVGIAVNPASARAHFAIYLLSSRVLCQVCVARVGEDASSLILVSRFLEVFKELGEVDGLVREHNKEFNAAGMIEKEAAADPVTTTFIPDDIKTLDDLSGKTTCLVTVFCSVQFLAASLPNLPLVKSHQAHCFDISQRFPELGWIRFGSPG